jgi:hypothetical protein
VPPGAISAAVARADSIRASGTSTTGSGVLAYGTATYDGAPTNVPLNAPIVGMAANPAGPGYWLVAADGGVFNYGGAGFYGSGGSINLNGPIVGIAATPDGKGYWLVAADGGIFTFGDAQFYGSTGNVRLNQPIVGMAATSNGGGYWLVASDGGIFEFGNAHFYGSTGDIALNAPVVGMAADPSNQGYWLVGADGGIFNFGDAPFLGTPAAAGVANWVTGMAATSNGEGYWIANVDGAVYNYGNASFYGNNLDTTRTGITGGIVAGPGNQGYWLWQPDQFDVAFTHPGGGGAIVAEAASQVGPDPDAGTFCNPYGPCEEWCALFATWVWEHAGVPIPQYAFVGDVYNWAADDTHVLPPTALPAPGDAVLYGTGPQNVDTAVHMGIVAQVWRDGAIDTIEGDAGPGPFGEYNTIINGPFLISDSNVYNGEPIFGFAVP